MNRILLAESMGLSPSSSGFRDRIMSAGRYGLIEGNYELRGGLTDGNRIGGNGPCNDQERVESLRTAFSNVEIFNSILNHYANARLPDSTFLKNTIEREPFNIDPEWSAEAAEVFARNAKYVGYLRDMNGSTYVVVDGSTTVPEPAPVVEQHHDDPRQPTLGRDPSVAEQPGEGREPETHAEPEPRTEARLVPMQVFVAHGRSTKPLDQLKRILNEWQVPFVVAVDEPHEGQPSL